MIVYYSNMINAIVHEPEPLYRTLFLDYKLDESGELGALKQCPAFIEYCKNTFVFKNVTTYDVFWNGQSFSSNFRGEHFLDKYLRARSSNLGLCSYSFPHFMFLAEKPLEIDFTPPIYHDVDLVKKAIMVPGSYDIGRHFRPLEIAFQFKKKNDLVKFKLDDPLFYIKFRTNEKIKFKKFFITEELKGMLDSLAIRDREIRPLEFWYNMFENSYKKRTLKLIKENLL